MSKKKGRRRLKVMSLVLTVCMVFTLFCCAKQLMVLRELYAKKDYYDNVYAELQAQNAELLATKELLNDETYMERLARQRFKLIHPNEYLVVPAETNENLEQHVEVKDSDVH